VIEIEALKRKFNLPFSLERIFKSNEKLKYYDFNKLHPTKSAPKSSIKSLQNKLNKGELFLDFLSGQGTNHFLLAISQSNVSLIKLNDSIPEYINDLKKSIIELDFNNYVKFGSKVYRTIFKDIDLKNYKKIIICPEGNVNDLVFEALLFSSKNSNLGDYRQLDYLVKHFQLQYTLSSSIYLKKIESIPLNIAAFAPFNPNRKYAELPFSSQLMNKLSDLNQVVYKNETATADNFLKTKSSILHFSGHGSIDEQSSTLSSLVFSDRTLNLAEIPLIQSPKLVVLNACNSSNGKIIQGDGVDGFVRAFHAAGAEVTIANLWEVDDKVSNELFFKFYSQLNHKTFVRNVMQKTKIAYIKNCKQSELAAPYYWAGHRVMGDGEIEAVSEVKSRYSFWVVLVVILALSILVIWRIKSKR
jgi:CHAT domain-containing protein